MDTFGNVFRITTFGESHGHAMGVIVSGVPAGVSVNLEDIQKDLDRRRPGQNELVSPRNEKDKVEVLSGIFESKTTGAPISMIVRNSNVRSEDYENLKGVFRPGHADFGYFSKYGVFDHKGGGRASARETVNWVAAGAIAKKIISDVKITACVKEVGGVDASKMNEKIESASKEGDSIGGIVEVVATGVPAGLGEPIFGKLNATIAQALMTINGAKGVEIGAGFEAARMKGTECNDSFSVEDGKIVTSTNNCGGILGGISTGMPIIARVAFKPTSSISKEQDTVTVDGKKTTVSVKGRHDPCIAIRAVPVVEAMMAIVLADAYLMNKK